MSDQLAVVLLGFLLDEVLRLQYFGPSELVRGTTYLKNLLDLVRFVFGPKNWLVEGDFQGKHSNIGDNPLPHAPDIELEIIVSPREQHFWRPVGQRHHGRCS